MSDLKRVIKTVIKILFFIMLFHLVVLSYLFVKTKYRPVKLFYLGCAEGKEDGGFFTSEAYTDFKYLYCNMGYWVDDDLEDLVKYNVDKPEEVNFELTQEKGMMYICSWHVPLKKFEYTSDSHPIGGGNYNRATFFKDEYQEGICFFYKAEDIEPGSMVLESVCAHMEWPDRTEEIMMCVIFFLLIGTLVTGWLFCRNK